MDQSGAAAEGAPAMKERGGHVGEEGGGGASEGCGRAERWREEAVARKEAAAAQDYKWISRGQPGERWAMRHR